MAPAQGGRSLPTGQEECLTNCITVGLYIAPFCLLKVLFFVLNKLTHLAQLEVGTAPSPIHVLTLPGAYLVPLPINL